jgi:hypothetical protein
MERKPWVDQFLDDGPIKSFIGAVAGWIGIIGIFVTGLSVFDDILKFADWVEWIAEHWHAFLFGALQRLPFGIDEPDVAPIAMALSVLLLALGARIRGPLRRANFSELLFPIILGLTGLTISGLDAAKAFLPDYVISMLMLGTIVLMFVAVRVLVHKGLVQHLELDVSLGWFFMVVLGVVIYIGSYRSFHLSEVMVFASILAPTALVIAGPPALSKILMEACGILAILTVLVFVASLHIQTEPPK